MSSIHELIEMLQAELRNCTARAERIQIQAELKAAVAFVAIEALEEGANATPKQALEG
jgi:hypothetical protein